MLVDYLLIALLGSLSCLDRATVQTLVSRPIVTAPLLASALGEPLVGLTVGAIIELLWLNQVSLGGYVPVHDTSVAVLITAGLITSFRGQDAILPEMIAFGFALLLPFAYLGRRMEIFLIQINGHISAWAIRAVANHDFKMINRLHILSLSLYFIFAFLLIFFGLVLAVEVMTGIYPLLPSKVIAAFRWSYLVLPLLGVAVALNAIKEERFWPILPVIALALLVLSEFFL